MATNKLTFNDLPEAVLFLSREVAELKDMVRHLTTPHLPVPSDAAPILSAKQVMAMTDWPPGTFYAKVAEMPEGIVLRGKSKRLLFDGPKFFSWLKTPVTQP